MLPWAGQAPGAFEGQDCVTADGGRARCLQRVKHGVLYSRYGAQGDTEPATSVSEAGVHTGRGKQGLLKSPPPPARPPSHVTEAPGLCHSKGIGSGPTMPEGLLEPGDATETLWPSAGTRFCKRFDSKSFRPFSKWSLWQLLNSAFVAQSHRQFVNKTAWPYGNKTFFTKIGNGPDVAIVY